jgi:hypothetical protein
MKLEFSQKIFEKSSNIKFHEKLSHGSRVGPCVQQKDRPDEAISHLSQFCKCALKVHDTGTVKPSGVLFQRIKSQDKNLHEIDNNV